MNAEDDGYKYTVGEITKVYVTFCIVFLLIQIDLEDFLCILLCKLAENIAMKSFIFNSIYCVIYSNTHHTKPEELYHFKFMLTENRVIIL